MREAKDADHREANVSQNRYLYMNDLKMLKSYTLHPLSQSQVVMGDSSWSTITSPLTEKWHNWEKLLDNHPDTEFTDLIIEGLKDGFHVGFNGQQLKSAKHNLPSCMLSTSNNCQ